MPSKGTTTQRGYGADHQKIRAHWAQYVAAGQATCARCGLPIAPDAKWDLGHDDTDPQHRRYSGPEHIGRECPAGGNGATEGRNKYRGDTSRTW